MKWQQWEIDVLLDDYEELGPAHVSAKVGRSKNAVSRQAKNFSLRVRNPKYRSGGHSVRVNGRFAPAMSNDRPSGCACASIV